MAQEMLDSGLVGFGAHTFSHIDARKINEKNINLEIYRANEEIKDKLGIIVKDFCLPYGYYDNKTIMRLSRLKIYKRIYTSDGMKNIKLNNDVDIIGRVEY